MIYEHCVMNIHDVVTDIIIKTEEKLLKFNSEEEMNLSDFKIVSVLTEKNLQYPGNGKIYIDFLTRVLSDEEVAFCGLPA